MGKAIISGGKEGVFSINTIFPGGKTEVEKGKLAKSERGGGGKEIDNEGAEEAKKKIPMTNRGGTLPKPHAGELGEGLPNVTVG